jgi:hypothetical protein
MVAFIHSDRILSQPHACVGAYEPSQHTGFEYKSVVLVEVALLLQLTYFLVEVVVKVPSQQHVFALFLDNDTGAA